MGCLAFLYELVYPLNICFTGHIKEGGFDWCMVEACEADSTVMACTDSAGARGRPRNFFSFKRIIINNKEKHNNWPTNPTF